MWFFQCSADMKDHDTVRVVVDEQSSKGDSLQKIAFCPPVVPNDTLYASFFPWYRHPDCLLAAIFGSYDSANQF